MSFEQTRNEQINEGRSRTLGVRPGYEGRKPAPRKPFVAKGHDAILKALQDEGGMICITRMGDGGEIVGKLLARDKFTITVQTNEGRKITFYKHAIESFEPVQVQ